MFYKLGENSPLVEVFGVKKPSSEAREADYCFDEGVFETMRTVQGALWNWRAHSERLVASARVFKVDIAKQHLKDLKRKIDMMLKGREGESRVRLQVSREGVVNVGVHEFHEFDEQKRREGVVVSIYPFERRNPTVKYIDPATRLLARSLFEEEGVEDVLWEDPKTGALTEGSMSNFGMVKDGVLVVPPEGTCLEGTSLLRLIEAAEQEGIEVRRAAISRLDLATADEAWISSVSKDVVPVRSVVGVRDFEVSDSGVVSRLMRKMMAEREL